MSVEPAPNGLSPLLGLLSVSDRTNRRLQTLLATYALSTVATNVVVGRARRLRAAREFSVAVAGSDRIYPEVHRWLLDSIPPIRRRALTARSGERGEDVPVDVDARSRPTRSLRLFYDSSRSQTVVLDGHRIRVDLERPDWSRASRLDDAENLPRFLADLERVVFTARNLPGRDAIVAFLTAIVERSEARPPRCYVAVRWGGWSRRGEGPTRPLDTVVLRAGQRERVVADLARFLESERAYARLGAPYHRGYLLEGPPGVGKTSLARALAAEFGLDLYYLPLASIPNDGVLIEDLVGVEPRSVLLLEDVDIARASRDREKGSGGDGKEGVTLAGLLNGLDGLVTPHGLITVMTTNDASVLDPALVRPGRVDLAERLDLLDDEQFGRLATVLLGRDVRLPPLARPLSPAEAIEAVKRNLDDPDAAIVALRALAIVADGSMIESPNEDLCLAVDLDGPARNSHVFCSRPRGHDGSHQNRHHE